jgi:hypothetical protein
MFGITLGIGSAIGIAGGLGAAGAVAGSFISSDASKSAANTQAQSAANASQLQQNMFNTTQANLSPYMQRGNAYSQQLQNQMGSLTAPYTEAMYQNSPGYQNQMIANQQGQNALLAQGAAGGSLGSGNMASALQHNQQQNAQQGYQQGLQNYNGQNLQTYNMLANQSAQGQNAAVGLGGLSAQVGSQIGNNMIGAGNAIAQGQIGQANAFSNGITGATNQLTSGVGAYYQNQLYQQYLNGY